MESSTKYSINMAKGYWVVAYRSISDDAAVKEYGKLVGPVLQANGGRPLVRTADAVQAVESGLKQRTVVIEFESFEKAKATYNSDEYKAATKVLGNAVERDFRIVEGVD
jgi:uncharacterized protein (DUF1330 family)